MVGKIVQHSRYGQGIIREYDAPYMKISFEAVHIEKRFAYPLVFDGFLRFEDSEAQAQAEAAISAIREEEDRKAEAHTLAIKQREQVMLEAHKAELKAKRVAAAKKAAGTRAASRKTKKD